MWLYPNKTSSYDNFQNTSYDHLTIVHFNIFQPKSRDEKFPDCLSSASATHHSDIYKVKWFIYLL